MKGTEVLRQQLRTLARWVEGTARDDDPVPGDDYDATKALAEAVRLIDQRDVLLDLMRRLEPLEKKSELRAAMTRIIGLCEGTIS